MLIILLLGFATIASTFLIRHWRERKRVADAASMRAQEAQAQLRKLSGLRHQLAEALAALGDQQASVLYNTVPRFTAIIGKVENLPLQDLMEPGMPSLSPRKRRRVSPTARALYGAAGVGTELITWLHGGGLPGQLLGVRLSPVVSALLSAQEPPCSADDIRLLRRLCAELGALREDAYAAQQQLLQQQKKSVQLMIDLQRLLSLNSNYRSLSTFPLPGQLHSPRAIVKRCVRTTQRLTQLTICPLRQPEDHVPQPAADAERHPRFSRVISLSLAR